MSREFIRTEQLSPVSGDQVVYSQDVRFEPAPRITADANGVALTGHHIAGSREDMNRLMACMEAAWSDHIVMKMQATRAASGDLSAAHFRPDGGIRDQVNGDLPPGVIPLAHGKSPSEQGGSSA